MAADNSPSCINTIEQIFDFLRPIVDDEDDDFEQIVRDSPNDVIKVMLREAVKMVRDHALTRGDKASEVALHREIDFMLGELGARGAL